MQLSPDAFSALFKNMGHQIGWRKSYACPCFNPASGAAKDDCPVCNGKGRIWNAEVVGFAGFTAQSASKAQRDFGVWEPGDSTLSIAYDSPLYAAGRFDRFRSLRSTHIFTDALRRGYGDLVWGTILSIDRVFWLDGSNNIVEGGIPTVGADETLTWPNGGEPPEGQTYSIAGVRYDEFYAYLQLPQNRPMHDGAALPRKLPVRKYDLFGR